MYNKKNWCIYIHLKQACFVVGLFRLALISQVLQFAECLSLQLPVYVAKYILENRRMVELVRPVKIRCHLVKSLTTKYDLYQSPQFWHDSPAIGRLESWLTGSSHGLDVDTQSRKKTLKVQFWRLKTNQKTCFLDLKSLKGCWKGKDISNT